MSAPAGKYPRTEASVRPFHLWDEKKRKRVPYRYYSDKKRAHMGALYEARWGKIGTVIAVIDVRYGRELGQYTRRVHDIHFTEQKT